MSAAKPNKIVLLTLLTSVCVLLVLLIFFMTTADMRDRNVGGTDGKLGGDFTLTSINGEVSLSDFRGQVVMLYFGFVNCSQVCPTSMKIMQQTLARMTASEVAQIQVLLVSIDVDNDDAQVIDGYVKKFHQNFVGLTGSMDDINHVVDEYGSYYSPTALKDVDDGRAYRHSSRYYLINKKGELVDAMRHSSTPNELKTRLRQLI